MIFVYLFACMTGHLICSQSSSLTYPLTLFLRPAMMCESSVHCGERWTFWKRLRHKMAGKQMALPGCRLIQPIRNGRGIWRNKCLWPLSCGSPARWVLFLICSSLSLRHQEYWGVSVNEDECGGSTSEICWSAMLTRAGIVFTMYEYVCIITTICTANTLKLTLYPKCPPLSLRDPREPVKMLQRTLTQREKQTYSKAIPLQKPLVPSSEVSLPTSSSSWWSSLLLSSPIAQYHHSHYHHHCHYHFLIIWWYSGNEADLGLLQVLVELVSFLWPGDCLKADSCKLLYD